MANSSSEVFGADSWWSRVIVTATGAADIRTIPAATAVGRTRRIVLQGWDITGHNTNAAATTFTIRNKTTNTIVFTGGSMGPTTGSVQKSASDACLAGAADEAIEINVEGAITGQIEVTCWGRILPLDFPSTRNNTGAP